MNDTRNSAVCCACGQDYRVVRPLVECRKGVCLCGGCARRFIADCADANVPRAVRGCSFCGNASAEVLPAGKDAFICHECAAQIIFAIRQESLLWAMREITTRIGRESASRGEHAITPKDRALYRVAILDDEMWSSDFANHVRDRGTSQLRDSIEHFRFLGATRCADVLDRVLAVVGSSPADSPSEEQYLQLCRCCVDYLEARDDLIDVFIE